MNIPPGMRIVFQGKADWLREIAARLGAAGVRAATGPLPGRG